MYKFPGWYVSKCLDCTITVYVENVHCAFFLIECFMQINISQLKLLIHLCWLINNTLPDVSKSLHTIPIVDQA